MDWLGGLARSVTAPPLLRATLTRVDTSRLLALRLAGALSVAVLSAAACTRAYPEPEGSEGASCPGVDRAPALFKRIQGTWKVRHTHFRRGQKPPGLATVGTLTIDGCRFTFSREEGAALHELRRWFPIVDRPSGVVEIIGEAPPNPDAFLSLDLGVIRLHGDPLAEVAEVSIESIELGVAARLQEGEYLLMKPTDKTLPTHTLAIERGVVTARGDEYPGGFDPESPAIDWEARRREVEAVLPRWREEEAARSAAPADRRDEPR